MIFTLIKNYMNFGFAKNPFINISWLTQSFILSAFTANFFKKCIVVLLIIIIFVKY